MQLRLKFLIAAPLLVGVLAVGTAGAASADPISNYAVTLSPENNSGVSGTAALTLNGNLLTLSVTATGLVPDQMHPAHIHGLLGAAAPNTQLAPPTADANGDGYVETPEAAPFSGPPLFGTPATVTPLAYGTASPSGVLSYTQTYNITYSALYDPDKLGLSLTPADVLGTTGGNTTPLVDRIFELHGLDVLAGIDGTTGAPGTLVYDPAMPVAAGLITLETATIVPEPGSLALLGVGVLGLLTLSRRQRKAA